MKLRPSFQSLQSVIKLQSVDGCLFYSQKLCPLRRCTERGGMQYLRHGKACGRNECPIGKVYWLYFFLTALILMVSSPTNIPLPLYGSGGLHLRTFAANNPS